jgi:large exoprotein involved in heme utilization and adhesion
LTTSTFGQGDAGNLNISANNISIDGTLSEIESDAAGEGQAGGGEIIVNTDNLTLTNGGAITAGTLGQGDAGKINITASNNISIDGKGEDGFLSGIGSEVGETATANGGGIEISTDNLLISNEGAITAATFGIGDAGIIKITADNISLNNRSQIAVDSQGAGQGGSLFIQADNLSLDNKSSLLASTPIGTGGNIALDIAEVLSLKGNSLISAEATGDANGGNVNINAQFVVAFPNDGNGNDIIARAKDGVGGNVNIAAEQVFNLKEGEAIDGNGTNDIDISSAFGLAGQVNIRTFTDDVIQGASELPRNPVEPEQTVAQACSSQGIAEGGNSFTVTGKGGVPPLPTEPMSSEVILSEGTVEAEGNLLTDSYNNSHQQPQGILTSQGYIIPAQGIVKTEDGKVMLVGYSVNNINQRTPVQSPHCGKS